MIFGWFCFLGLPAARLDSVGPQDPPAHKDLLDLRDPLGQRDQLAHKGLQGLQDLLVRQEQQGLRVLKA